MRSTTEGATSVMSAWPALLLGLALACLLVLTGQAPPAAASHSVTELVSTGPTGGDAGMPPPSGFPRWRVSRDGERYAFPTNESLVASDTDGRTDVYLRANGTTTLLSTGPSGGNGAFDATVTDASADLDHIFFTTQEQLVPGDTDGSTDVYEYSGGNTHLATPGNGAFPVRFGGISEDGSKMFFDTDESLTPADVNTNTDVYEQSGGTTTLISTGVAGSASFRGTTPDGAHVYFRNGQLYEHSAGITTLVSTGPLGSGPFQADLEAFSDDGSHVVFSTANQLVVEDTDGGRYDLYERSGGTTTLVSTGPTDTQSMDACPDWTGIGLLGPCMNVASADGTHLFFSTRERLTSDDTDDRLDVYERSGGTTTLVSTGPTGGNGPYDVLGRSTTNSLPIDRSDDGSRVFFTTAETLTSDDLDGGFRDVYERSGGTTTLVSKGPREPAQHSGLCGASSDGSRVMFVAADLLIGENDGFADMYEREGGRTWLISTGPADTGTGTGCNPISTDGRFLMTPDGSTVLFVAGTLVSSDTDSFVDLYARKVAYETPGSASAVHLSLVPVFRQCGTGGNPTTEQHAPPLGVGSCSPLPNAGQVARIGPGSTGSVDLAVVPGDDNTGNGDQANVTIQSNLTDVRTAAGADYDPNPSGADVTLVARLRFTDTANGGSGADPGTATDFDFSIPVNCTATADPGTGSTCTLNTSADAVTPGEIKESKSTVLQVFRARLNDSGTNGTRGDSDDRIFATEGVFSP